MDRPGFDEFLERERRRFDLVADWDPTKRARISAETYENPEPHAEKSLALGHGGTYRSLDGVSEKRVELATWVCAGRRSVWSVGSPGGPREFEICSS
jgi:hypothetical protein